MENKPKVNLTEIKAEKEEGIAVKIEANIQGNTPVNSTKEKGLKLQKMRSSEFC